MLPQSQRPAPAASAKVATTERLLRAVVAASQELLARDFATGLRAALKIVGESTGLDRVYALRYDEAQNAGFFLAEHCAPGTASVTALFGPGPYAYADYAEVWRPLMAGRTYSSPTSAKTGANAELNEASGTKSDLFVPIFVEGIFWGALGFDDCTGERVYADGEIQVLHGVATVIAAAVAREAAERGRSAAEYARTSEATRIAELLTNVVSSSRELIEAPDFEAGVHRWLGRFGEVTTATRATLYDLVVHAESGLRTARMLCEWTRPGVAGSVPVSFAAPHVIDPRGAEDMIEVMVSGRPAAFHTADCAEPMRSFLAGQGNATVVAVPLFLDGRQWGVLSFDYAVRNELSPGDLAVLQTAADTLAVIMKRIEAERAAITEREARLAVEQARTTEVEAHNAELVHRERLLQAVNEASRLLVEHDDLEAGLSGALAALHRLTGVDRVFINRYAPEEAATYFWMEHKRADLRAITDFFGPGPWPDDAFAEVAHPLREGRVYRSLRAARSRQNASANAAGSSLSDLIVPIVVRGAYWGCIGFDDSTHPRVWSDREVGVLQTAASAVAAAILRHSLEQIRQVEANRHAARLERHSRLLAAVAFSAEELLGARELGPCMDAVLARIGAITRADRACLARIDWTPGDGRLLAWQEIVHEWTKPGATRQMETAERRFAMEREDATWLTVFNTIAAEGWMLAKVDDLAEPFRTAQLQLGLVWNLCYAVTVEGKVWGLLGFDYATPAEDYDAADLEALKTVAAVIANALLRERLEARRLEAERARADQAAELNHLLEGVVAASRALLEAEDFQSGLKHWLAFLAEAVDADRANLGSFASSKDRAHVAVNQIDWAKPGMPAIAANPVPASGDFVAWAERLQRGESVWAHRDELLDPASVRYWEDTGCFTNLIVPVVVDRRTVAWLCFDWQTRREWKPAYGTLLRTAADGPASAIKRNEAVRATLAEREGRATEMAAFNAELALNNRLLAAAARASALLSVSADFDAAVRQALGLVAEAARFDEAMIVRYVDPEGNPDAAFFKLAYAWRARAETGEAEPFHGQHDSMPVFASKILRRDSVVDFRREELPDLATSQLQQAMSARYYLAGSIWIDDQPWGAFSFADHVSGRRRSEEEKGLLAAAGRAIGQAVNRRLLAHQTERLHTQIMVEREQAAKDRAVELAAANAALTHALANIATEPEITRVPELLLIEIARATQAEIAYWFDFDAAANTLETTLRVRAGRLVEGPAAGEPALIRDPFDADISPAFQALAATGEIMQMTSTNQDPPGAWPGLADWHRREARTGALAIVIKIGAQPLGLLGLGFRELRSLNSAEEQLLRALSNQFALATKVTRLASLASATAVVVERNRIARDLHDTLAQGFTGVLAQLGAAEGAVEAGRLGEMNLYVERAKALARFSLAEARSSVHALRPETNAAPLATRLRQMLAGMTQGTALDAGVEESGAIGVLGPAADWCVHKFVQEALANAVKHSAARTFRVELAWGSEFSACASDDGRGFNPATTAPGLGLLSMHERAVEAGGHFSNESRPGYGTRLCLSFPLPRAALPPDAKIT